MTTTMTAAEKRYGTTAELASACPTCGATPGVRCSELTASSELATLKYGRPRRYRHVRPHAERLPPGHVPDPVDDLTDYDRELLRYPDQLVELPDGRRVPIPQYVINIVPLDVLCDYGVHILSLCKDCGTDTIPRDGRSAEYYMVHDEVWAQANIGKDDGLLCVGCLERRLGRELDAQDFTDAPTNKPSPDDSPRIAERKQANRPEQLALVSEDD